MSSFTVSAILGVALGFLFGVGCAAAVLYSIFLAGYRRALHDAAAGGTFTRYRAEARRLGGVAAPILAQHRDEGGDNLGQNKSKTSRNCSRQSPS